MKHSNNCTVFADFGIRHFSNYITAKVPASEYRHLIYNGDTIKYEFTGTQIRDNIVYCIVNQFPERYSKILENLLNEYPDKQFFVDIYFHLRKGDDIIDAVAFRGGDYWKIDFLFVFPKKNAKQIYKDIMGE